MANPPASSPLSPVHRLLKTFLSLVVVIFSPWLLSAEYAITGSSWISGSGDGDYATGVAIKANGTINVAAIIGDAAPGGLTPVLLNAATPSSAGAVLQVSPDGDDVLSVARVADLVLDMAMDDGENIYLAAGSAGIIKLNPSADTVLWTAPNGGYCRRLDVGADGTVIGLNNSGSNAGTCYVYDNTGTELESFGGWRFTQDVALKSDIARVYQTGFKNDHSGCNPVQVAYLRCLDYSGTEIWRNYDWPGTWLDNCDGDGWDNLMADTRGYRVTIGQDGLLYAAFESAGGNHIFSREPGNGDPDNLKTNVTIVGGDMWFAWWNTASEHKTFIGRYDPASGDYLLGQQLCTRYWNGNYKGNALRVVDGALAADGEGKVYVGGVSASGLPFDPTHATSDQSYTAGAGEAEFNPFPMTAEDNVYSGGAYLIVLSSDLSKRLYCTRLSAGTTRAIDARILEGKSEASLVWAGNVAELNMDWQDTNRKERVLHTVNPFQSLRAGGTNDGFLSVIGQGPVPSSAPRIRIDWRGDLGKWEFSFQSEPGVTYQLMSSQTLNPTSWNALETPLPGDGGRQSIRTDPPVENRMFYRIETD